MTIDARDHRSNVERSREYQAAQALARGRDSKSTHRYLSLRVYWRHEGQDSLAIMCRMHRDKLYRQFPNDMWDSSEWFPADACEQCLKTERSKYWVE